MLNTEVAPMNDIRVRQALAYAADPEVVVTEVWNGIPPVATGPFVAGSPYFAPTGYPGYNLRKAIDLVKEVEHDTGKPLPTFNFGTLPASEYVRINELIQAMWLKAGIHCNIQPMQEATLIEDAVTGDFQSTVWTQFAAPDPDANYVWWSSKSVAPIGSLSLNMARNSDPLIQQALDTGRESTDPRVRALAYQEVARRLAVDLPYLWSNRAVSTVAASNSVQNFTGPTFPGGARMLGMIGGVIWPVEIWRS
jgi:peptide/nickel transport system substrate-binding protein